MFKKLFKKILVFILELESKLILKKYQPEIIAITGSVGKTSVKEAIFAVLAAKFSVRKSEKSYNSELGVTLALIGAANAWYSSVKWLKNIFQGIKLIISRDKSYPKLIILELGADRPGDISRLIRYIQPKVGVVTAIGEVPVHVEFFAGAEELAAEKAKLVEILEPLGWAVLLADDDAVSDMKEKTRAQTLTYGFDEHADIRASEYLILYREENRFFPEGVSFKVDHGGSSIPIRLFNVFGRQAVYAALAAVAIGIIYKMNLVEIAEALARFSAPPGRLKLIEGEKETWILDDTYNASPQAMHAALDLLRDLPAKRKIAVLGDMLELGQFTIQAHRKVGGQARGIADIVITVGPRSKFIADELIQSGFESGRLYSVSDSIAAGKELEKIIKPGDLILVKGSQAMRMERVVEEIMARPEEKEKLLVRQEPEWLNKE
ncbi:MAG: UDP-N-acetylmuramoyl-tripeptide--D-alanyl-D-alanine ligase [Patescibacteria group bacterium]